MTTLQDLNSKGMLLTSKLIKKLLYGENSFYGSKVNFTTTESVGDFATHATTGKALAFLIAHKIHKIYVEEYEQNQPNQKFICHELSGGNGQLAHDILSILKIMADNEATTSKGRSWSNLWKNLKLRTFEISEKLSAEQNIKSQKFNYDPSQNASPTNMRYQSINKKASKKHDDELVYLTFSNELFDALPVDIIYRSPEDETKLLIQFCLPIVPKENLTLIGIKPLAMPEEFTKAPVESDYLNRQSKLLSGECVIPPTDVIPNLTDVEYIPFYMPLDDVTDLKYKQDIREYVLASGLEPGRLTCYSAPYVKLLKVLREKSNLHHMHFDYFSTFMPQFRYLSQYFRQYPADEKYIHDESPYRFTFTNHSVDITYNPDLHLAANIFANQNLNFAVAHQAAPYILQSREFEEMIEVLRKSHDPELGGDRIINDIAKFIVESTPDFKFFEVAPNLQQPEYARSTLAPLSTPKDAPFEVAKYGISAYSPYMRPCYDMKTFLQHDQLGNMITAVTDTQQISNLCNEYSQSSAQEQLVKIIEALLEHPLLLNMEIVIDSDITTPWKFLMLNPAVDAEAIAELLKRSGLYADFFVRDMQGGLLVDNSKIDLAKRQQLINILQFWQFCLHTCIQQSFTPGIKHLSNLYTALDFNACKLPDTSNLIREFPELQLKITPMRFAQKNNINLQDEVYKKLKLSG